MVASLCSSPALSDSDSAIVLPPPKRPIVLPPPKRHLSCRFLVLSCAYLSLFILLRNEIRCANKYISSSATESPLVLPNATTTSLRVLASPIITSDADETPTSLKHMVASMDNDGSSPLKSARNTTVERSFSSHDKLETSSTSNSMVSNTSATRTGVLVLGMHRSGTSLLTGLLSLGCGYSTGGDLIPPRKHNPKGYFERVDVVNQNIQFLQQQKSPNKVQAYQPKNDVTALSSHGRSAIGFFNQKNQSSLPWIQKDPRMCITLKEWLPHFETMPAVLFTYRHPLEVARSLRRRDRRKISSGLKMWMAYNEAIIRNSKGLCLVGTTNDDILRDPIHEVGRIAQQLTTECGVMPPPHLTPIKSVVDEFVDVKLQTSKRESLPGCNETYDGTAVGLSKASDVRHYRQAMRLYCDIESGLAFTSDYKIL